MELSRRNFLVSGTAGVLSPLLASVCASAWSRAGTHEADVWRAALGAEQVVRSIIIDTDPGVDDAVSILLALKSREVKVEALTVVAGNVETQFGAPNALALLELAGRSDIPVALGAQRPLIRTPLTARIAHGSNGLGDVELPAPKTRLVSQHAADLIIERTKASPGQLTLLALGPLTNIALALLKDPSIAPQIPEVAFMGGTILSQGNVTPVATFNIYTDPEAAKIVLNSPIPRITMVGTDVTTKVQFAARDFDRLERSGTAAGRVAAALGRFRLKRLISYPAMGRGEATIGFNDLPAIAVVIDRSLFTIERMRADVETKGELTAGMIVANRQNRVVRIGPEGAHLGLLGAEPIEPNLDVCVGINEKGVKELFLERISAP